MGNQTMGMLVEDLIELLGEYQAKHPKMKSIKYPRFEQVQQKLKKPQYVISVIGSMKAGKSTFINSMLGEDLMPNENAACTLTTTEISIGSTRNRVIKEYDQGKLEILQGDRLAEIFHEDVKQSRQGKKVNFKYKVNHMLHALKNREIADGMDVILVDTPGINEMEGLGVKKEDILNVFKHALEKTDEIIYVIDYQYYKAEENLEIIELIKAERPDLLSNITVVVNKIDKMTHKDGTIEDVLAEISRTLEVWGIKPNRLHPLSAKKALFSRLIENCSPYLDLYRTEIDSLLPMIQLEINGRIVNAKMDMEDGAVALLEESHLDKIEQQLFVPIVEGRTEIIERSYGWLIQSGTKEIVQQTNEIIFENHARCKEFEAEISKLSDEQKKMKLIIDLQQNFLTTTFNELKKEISVWVKKETLTAYHVELGYFPAASNLLQYHSQDAALKGGKKQLGIWIDQEAERFQRNAIVHYEAGLKYKAVEGDYFYSLNKFVQNKCHQLNELMRLKGLYNNRYTVDESINVIPPAFTAKKPSIKKEKYESRVRSTTDYETKTETFLFIFTNTRTIEKYRYSLSYAEEFAKEELSKDLMTESNTLYEQYKKMKYINFLHDLFESLRVKLNESMKMVEKDISNREKEIDSLQYKIQRLKSEVQLMENFKEKAEGRTSLLTRQRIIQVKASEDLDKAIANAPGGTILQLGKGHFALKKPLKLSKSIGFEGVVGKTTLEISHLVEVKEDYSLTLKDLTVSFAKQKAELLLHAYYLNVENCRFRSTILKSTFVKVTGKTQVEIRRSEFSHAYVAMSISTSAKNIIEHCRFNSNYTGIHVVNSRSSKIINNIFTHHDFSAIRSSNDSSPLIHGNDITDGQEYGILSEGYSLPQIIGNKVSKNNTGMNFIEHSMPNVEQNVIENNLVGISVENFSTSVFKQNKISNNRRGIHGTDHVSIMFTDNEVVENSAGLLFKGYAKVKIVKNYIGKNTADNGLEFSGCAKGQLKENVIVENAVYGAAVGDSAEIEAFSNKVERNEKAGFYFEKKSNSILKENVFGGNQIGVSFKDETSFSMDGNTFENNLRYGISLNGKHEGIIANNRFTANLKLPVYLATKQLVQFQDNKQQLYKWFQYGKVSFWLSQLKIKNSNAMCAKEKKNEQRKSRRAA